MEKGGADLTIRRVSMCLIQCTPSLISETVMEYALDKLAVNFGQQILKIVPGRVSTEIGKELDSFMDSFIV